MDSLDLHLSIYVRADSQSHPKKSGLRPPEATEHEQVHGPNEMHPTVLRELADIVAKPVSIIFDNWMDGSIQRVTVHSSMPNWKP